MSQLSSHLVVEPFGEVNVLPGKGGSIHVRATILMKPAVEGAQTGLAIDGSASMKNNFGASGAVSALFAAAANNIVEPVAKTLGTYLANFDSDGSTSIIYWACGMGGFDVEDLGDMNSAQIKTQRFSAPKNFGSGTKLLPALKFFTEQKFPTAPWTILLFITDGALEDLDAVKAYSIELGKQIVAGKRKFLKLVLVGVGPEAEAAEGQLEELDDMDYGGLKDAAGNEIDLWDHKMAKDMQKCEEIFAEVVDEKTILAPSAQILDAKGQPVTPLGRASYADGLPALLNFEMPAGSDSFSLVLPGQSPVVQKLV